MSSDAGGTHTVALPTEEQKRMSESSSRRQLGPRRPVAARPQARPNARPDAAELAHRVMFNAQNGFVRDGAVDLDGLRSVLAIRLV